nr:copper amine oxidase N-terminal domain-containing protein [Paenibacillus lemnae]
MLPMRVIFQKLGAKVTWNQKTQTVTAVRDNSTIVLKINAKTATINGKFTALDVPAKNLKGTTMVPVRFVSEALGEKIGWNSRTQTVTVTTSDSSAPDNSLGPVTYITLKDIGDSGDGRDLQVSFSKADNEHQASQYRVFVVKSSKASAFNEASAFNVPPSSYAAVFPNGSDPSLNLTATSRDTDGEMIRENQAYVAYVLAVSKFSGSSQLSKASAPLTLLNQRAVDAVSNVRATDVSNFGDGRDLSVSFTRAASENNISTYRVFVVKTQNASGFNLNTAKSLPSTSYTNVSRTSSGSTTLSLNLGSSARDTSGELIRSGVPYTVYVMSVSSNENTMPSKLSSPSSSLTLNSSSSAVPVITQVTDISDYGDGRDLRVSFNKVTDESSISSYRIYVVKSTNSGSFDLNRANNISSSNYTTVGKTGNNQTHALNSGSRDVDGAAIRNGIYYRVYVMAVSSSGSAANHVLSAASNEIMLLSGNRVDPVSNVAASDISDFNDGRDLRISFNRANNESNISHYRIFAVKYNRSSSFDVNSANNLSSYYYTQVNKTGYNISQTLSAVTRDTDGDYIRSGSSYRIFVLSVSSSNADSNTLSSSSPYVTLTGNQLVTAVTNIAVNDISDYNDGRDLRVTFNRAANETVIDSYRVLVVKNSDAGRFDLSWANNVGSSNYTYVSKTGSNLTANLSSAARDVNGDQIQNGIAYRVFVLSVGSGSYAGTYALSSYSPSITLTGNTAVPAVTNVTAADDGNNNDGRDLIISFKKADNESRISGYRVYVVKVANAETFTLASANAVSPQNYTSLDKTGRDFNQSLTSDSRDVNGDRIRNMTPYQVFVLSVSSDGVAANNSLSGPPYPSITLEGTKVAAPINVSANVYSENGVAQYVAVSFSVSSSVNVGKYRVMVVPQEQSFGESGAAAVAEGNYTEVDPQEGTISVNLPLNVNNVLGAPLQDSNRSYKVVILAVGNANETSSTAISAEAPLTGWPMQGI